MNLCFFSGSIISKPEFKFIITGKNTSICYYTLRLENGTKIRVNAYDENADLCYRNLRQGNYIFVARKIE